MGNNKYHIPFSGLIPGIHQFTIEITDSFFELFPESEVKKANINITVDIDKKINVALFEILLKGFVELPCDRCLDDIQLKINHKYEVIGKEFEVDEDRSLETEDFIELSATETHLDLSAPICEFINLSVPMQRLCSNTTKKKCNTEVIEKLKEVSTLKNKTDETNDPRWDALKNIKLN